MVLYWYTYYHRQGRQSGHPEDPERVTRLGAGRSGNHPGRGGVEVQPVAGTRATERGGRLIISGDLAITDDDVHSLRLSDQRW